MKKKTVAQLKKYAVPLVLLLFALAFLANSQQPKLVLTQSVYDDRVGFINIEVHQISFLQKFLKQFMSYVEFSKNSYLPGELVEGSAIIDANTNGELFGKIELLGWYQTKLQDYCNSYPATPENCGRPSDNTCPFGGCTWEITWQHNAPTSPGEYSSRLYIYDNNAHLVEATPLYSFLVEEAPANCPPLPNPTDWSKSADVFYNNKDVGDVKFRTVYESKPYPECSQSRIEEETICIAGYHVEGTTSRTAPGKQDCVPDSLNEQQTQTSPQETSLVGQVVDDIDDALEGDSSQEKVETSTPSDQNDERSKIILESLELSKSKITLVKSPVLQSKTSDDSLVEIVGFENDKNWIDEKNTARIGVRLGVVNKNDKPVSFNYAVSIWPAEKWEAFRKKILLQSLYSSTSSLYEFKDTCGMRQDSCRSNPYCEAGWALEGHVEGLKPGESVYFPRYKGLYEVPAYYALHLPPQDGVFADGSSAFSPSGEYYVVAYLYDKCYFIDPENSHSWSFMAKKFKVTYPAGYVILEGEDYIIPGENGLKPAFTKVALASTPYLENYIAWEVQEDEGGLRGVTPSEFKTAMKNEISNPESPVCTLDTQCVTNNCVLPSKDALFSSTPKYVYETFRMLAERTVGKSSAWYDLDFLTETGVGLCVEKEDSWESLKKQVAGMFGISTEVAQWVILGGIALLAVLLLKKNQDGQQGL